MVVNALLIVRVLILVIGLSAFYRLWVSSHLVKKSIAWLIFQISIGVLWLSSSYSYHGHLNPFPQAVALLIVIFSIGVLGIMLIFALGVQRRQGSWKIEPGDSQEII